MHVTDSEVKEKEVKEVKVDMPKFFRDVLSREPTPT